MLVDDILIFNTFLGSMQNQLFSFFSEDRFSLFSVKILLQVCFSVNLFSTVLIGM